MKKKIEEANSIVENAYNQLNQLSTGAKDEVEAKKKELQVELALKKKDARDMANTLKDEMQKNIKDAVKTAKDALQTKITDASKGTTADTPIKHTSSHTLAHILHTP